MSWTKGQLVNAAYSAIGYAEYVFDLEPEQLNAALRKIDVMMASWAVMGIDVGYYIPTTQDDTSLEQDSGLADFAIEAVYQNLALRLATDLGKAVPPLLSAFAKDGYDNLLLGISVTPPKTKLPNTLPAGAGNREGGYCRRNYLYPEDDNVVLPPENEVNFSGE